MSRLGRMLVYRLPGPSTMSSASAIARSASSDGADVVGREPDALDADGARMIGDWPSTTSRRRAGVERQRRRRDRHDLAAHGEDPVHLADALLEVAALDRGHRREQQVADGVPGQAAATRPSAPAGKRYWSSSLISGSASASAAMQLRMSPTGGMPELLAQHARRAAVVGDGDDRGQVAGVLLEAAQQRRQPGPAADRHDPRPAREEPLLVDHLDERLVRRRRSRKGSVSARTSRYEPNSTSAEPDGRDDQAAHRERQELERERGR